MSVRIIHVHDLKLSSFEEKSLRMPEARKNHRAAYTRWTNELD